MDEKMAEILLLSEFFTKAQDCHIVITIGIKIMQAI